MLKKRILNWVRRNFEGSNRRKAPDRRVGSDRRTRQVGAVQKEKGTFTASQNQLNKMQDPPRRVKSEERTSAKVLVNRRKPERRVKERRE